MPLMDVRAFREPRPKRVARQAVTLARAVRAGRRASARAAAPTRQVDGAALRDLLAEAGAEARLVEVPVDRAPWTPTGLRVRADEQVTWLVWGRVMALAPLGIGVAAALPFRLRVGGDPPQLSSRDTFTFTARRDGWVGAGSLFPGELRDGVVVTDRVPYRAISGTMTAVVARWPADADPRAALDSVAARDGSGLVAAELARLADPPAPPPGWAHHPLTPHADLYAAAEEGIAVTAEPRTAAIIRRPVDVPLTPSLRLRWSWRLDELPSRLPEDTSLTHDYLSVALEFDDGQDLTWHWSSGLPPGFAYRCPLEHWRRRETHVVARSGSADLGRWVDEERPVLADHAVAIGGRAPARVVSAWLIGLTVWQGGRGRGTFGRIELVAGDRAVRVL